MLFILGMPVTGLPVSNNLILVLGFYFYLVWYFPWVMVMEWLNFLLLAVEMVEFSIAGGGMVEFSIAGGGIVGYSSPKANRSGFPTGGNFSISSCSCSPS